MESVRETLCPFCLTYKQGMFFTVHTVPETEPVSESSEQRIMKVGN